MIESYEPKLEAAFELLAKIEEGGGEAYIVGGAVRDYLSGRPLGDIDIASSEPPSHIQRMFDKVIPVGIEHGTVIVRFRSVSYEVTTFRTEEGYEDYRHPDEVTFVRDIKADLARRDFTINAMAMDRFGTIIDPYNGLTAIKNRQVKAVGDPFNRFTEDPLRMMRAARFSSQLEFEVEKDTIQAISAKSSLLKYISVERIAVETLKLYQGRGYKNAIELVSNTDLITYLPIFNTIPSFSNVAPLVQLSSWPELVTYYMAYSPSFSIKEWMKRWKLSNKERRETEELNHALNEYLIKNRATPWLLYVLPEYLQEAFARVLQAKGLADESILIKLQEGCKNLPILSRRELAFQPQDLISLFADKQKGPWISEYMKEIEHQVVERHLPNDYEKIKEWALLWNPPENN
ncbi:CCA tRNA nucleotidyltransferase [Halobacillus halophilus]|uniref:CCA tRNA nucleotidyltransferase n=1 Tax=Halobacillus halophilus TaxID=1570 RepID=UPI001CD34387|nr:CCA tRNA nucleotidyltransferase [Halobacillus halophilus]MCA1009444.1 CCA tRNA nucleotidyltransferase [Halobacillus halophilus]